MSASRIRSVGAQHIMQSLLRRRPGVWALVALLASACSSPLDPKWERANTSSAEQSKAQQECRGDASKSAPAKGLFDNAVQRGQIEAKCMRERGYQLVSPSK